MPKLFVTSVDMSDQAHGVHKCVAGSRITDMAGHYAGSGQARLRGDALHARDLQAKGVCLAIRLS